MTEPAPSSTEPPEPNAQLTPMRALAYALFVALVVAHIQPLFATGALMFPNFAEHYVVPLPLVAAEWVRDFVWLGVLGGAIAFAALRAGALPETLRALLLAMLAALLVGLGLSARFGLAALGTWALALGSFGAVFAVAGRATRVSPLGFVLGATLLALGGGYSNALPADAGTTALNHLGALALGLGAVWATSSVRAPMGFFAVVIALALAAIVESSALASLSSSSAPPLPSPASATSPNDAGARPNLILIVLDTFRADAFDRSEAGNTPNLAGFASEARVAENARSTSSWTLPSHASLFTGSYPTTHGAHFLPRGSSERESRILVDQNVTLAELLAARGYATWGIVANHGYLHGDTNIDQGFDIWDDRYAVGRWPYAALSNLTPRLAGLGALDRFARWVAQLDEAQRHYLHKSYRVAADINVAALALLDRAHAQDAAKPFFLFLNYMDAHAPYVPLATTRSELGSALNPAWLDLHDGLGGIDPKGPGGPAVLRGERDLRDDERTHLEAAYAGEVHDLDAALGQLFNGLKQRGLYQDAWIVVTADHGEFLGEHRLLGHASELYEEAIRVPLLVRAPGGADARAIEGQVQLVDVLPSLAPHFGLTLPAAVDGSDFDRIGDRAAVAEHYEYPQFLDAFGSRFEGDRRAWLEAEAALYAFSKRAPEWSGAADAQTQERMQRELSEWIARRRPVVSSGDAQPALSDEERRRLERLGYL